ncbi:conserved hypothetical protein [Methanolacinia petrolearia DSM 11571]|uniref:Actinobacteria/chloroflexi VLRF1 release factor domain-containing protein n=1 Tax=Methanolacinia petrolearia (strain DSM 11571 / OCM 486 / SEBR 4847) TaxID=679926 RepID=E1RG81_METP4|nr:Vms1/Ankzf1 family peptidyl-tRNA hydrolase [Methanolacinia petrolearia]ADN37395.1 conserved hypothetical protein [Methanolacinia petrolearia DSM 11571]
MLDKFLNRGAEEEKERLLNTIRDLEKDNESLRKRLSKREKKAAEDPARRQELEESLKKALTKIGVLEHELEACRNENNDSSGPSFKSFKLSLRESMEFIDLLSSLRSEKGELLSVYGTPGDDEILSKVPVQGIADFILDDQGDTGFVLFHGGGSELLPVFASFPPFPVESSFSVSGNSYETAELSAILNSERAAAFVLAHAGESFIGIADAKNVLFGELVRTGVKEKHSKGGWSQKRFERLREEDIRHHAEKAAAAFDSMMESHSDIVECLVLLGDIRLAEAIAAGSPLERIIRTTDIKPDRHCGEALRKEIWSSVWFRF